MSHYLNEFVFRFNRRRSRSRGVVFYRLLELAVGHEPMRFQDLIASRRPRKVPPEPPKQRGHPTSLEPHCYWRTWPVSASCNQANGARLDKRIFLYALATNTTRARI